MQLCVRKSTVMQIIKQQINEHLNINKDTSDFLLNFFMILRLLSYWGFVYMQKRKQGRRNWDGVGDMYPPTDNFKAS